jgi:bacterial/archaeal transporter family-2 protein
MAATGSWAWMGWAAPAGAAIPVTAALNGALGRTLGNAPAAVFILFAVGLLASTAFLLATGSAGALGRIGNTVPTMFGGGVIVAFYIFSVTYLAPRYGVGNVILFVMVAQIATSAAIDHFALFGAAQRPVGGLRLVGIGLMLVGLAITQVAVARSPAQDDARSFDG